MGTSKFRYCPACREIWVPGRAKCKCGYTLDQQRDDEREATIIQCAHVGCTESEAFGKGGAKKLVALGRQKGYEKYIKFYCEKHYLEFHRVDSVNAEFRRRVDYFTEQAKLLKMTNRQYFTYWLGCECKDAGMRMLGKKLMAVE